MRNEMVMDQLIPLQKLNKESEEWEDDVLAHYSNQTSYKNFDKKVNHIIHLWMQILYKHESCLYQFGTSTIEPKVSFGTLEFHRNHIEIS
jgi:hypothetical protein